MGYTCAVAILIEPYALEAIPYPSSGTLLYPLPLTSLFSALHSSKFTIKSVLTPGHDISLDNYIPPCPVPNFQGNGVQIMEEIKQN
jgi:hypothetical protein